MPTRGQGASAGAPGPPEAAPGALSKAAQGDAAETSRLGRLPPLPPCAAACSRDVSALFDVLLPPDARAPAS